jgi:hypothetical protein
MIERENPKTWYWTDGNSSDVQHQLLNNKISEYYAKEKGSERYGAPFT